MPKTLDIYEKKKSRLMLTISNNSNINETKRSLYPEKKYRETYSKTGIQNTFYLMVNLYHLL